MKKLITTFILIAVIISLIAIVVVGSKKKNDQVTQANSATTQEKIVVDNETKAEILYWGTTCPHCHDTIEWIEKNKIEEKVVIIRKEVYNNRTNSLELSKKAQGCGLNEMNIGVPFMYTSEGECLIGTPDITEYLDQKVNQEIKIVEDASISATVKEGDLQ